MTYATICIDLGASYTKIGFRPSCDPKFRQPFNQEAEVFKFSGDALIPSLAIRTRDKGTPWLFGHEAGKVHPLPPPEMEVHANWKSDLYRMAISPPAPSAPIPPPPVPAASFAPRTVASGGPQSLFAWLRSKIAFVLADFFPAMGRAESAPIAVAAATEHPALVVQPNAPNSDFVKTPPEIVAKAFFAWLLSKIDPYVPDWDRIRVRVTLPAFKDSIKFERLVLACMTQAGWRAAKIEFTTEPHANAVGLMTLGRNFVVRRPSGLWPIFTVMFGQNSHYIERARAAVLREGTDTLLRVTIVDIGAFTTDLARLEFDVATVEKNDGLEAVEQESYEVGTHDHLDGPFWRQMEQCKGLLVKELTFDEQEELKTNLFARKEYALIVKGQSIVFGGEEDFSVAVRCAKTFVDTIWDKIGENFGSRNRGVIFLSGGGSQIGPVVEELKQRFHGVLDQPVVNVVPPTTTDGLTGWRASGANIERLATAVGGVSVLPLSTIETVRIGLSAPVKAGNRTRRASRFSATERECSCHGNSDCPRCDGKGYVPV